MRFYSKHDTWLGVILYGPISYALLQTYAESGLSGVTMSLFFLLIFITWIWIGTYYVIEDEVLKVRSGPVFGNYDIAKIVEIKDSRNWLSSPACSLDRLYIKGETFNLLISPKDKEQFVSAIQEVNSRVTYTKRG